MATRKADSVSKTESAYVSQGCSMLRFGSFALRYRRVNGPNRRGIPFMFSYLNTNGIPSIEQPCYVSAGHVNEKRPTPFSL
jgi:hypothetical protein